MWLLAGGAQCEPFHLCLGGLVLRKWPQEGGKRRGEREVQVEGVDPGARLMLDVGRHVAQLGIGPLQPQQRV